MRSTLELTLRIDQGKGMEMDIKFIGLIALAMCWKAGFVYLASDMAKAYWRDQRFWIVATLFFDVFAIFWLLVIGQRGLPNEITNFRRIVKATGRIPRNFSTMFPDEYQGKFLAAEREMYNKIEAEKGTYFAGVFAAERYFFFWSEKSIDEAVHSTNADCQTYTTIKEQRELFSQEPDSIKYLADYVDRVKLVFATEGECGLIRKDDVVIVARQSGVTAYLSTLTYKDTFKKWNEMATVTDLSDKLFILSKVLARQTNWELKPLSSADC